MINLNPNLFMRSILLTVSLFGWMCALFQGTSLKMTTTHLEITKTWNNRSVDPKHYVKIDLLYLDNLHIKVSSPFYDDPSLPDMTKHPGTMDKLYDYEVVEVFLLGENEHYLEIELGPKSQYLVLELQGYRNVTRYPIDLLQYHSKISGHQWSGTAIVPKYLLPRNINKMNAYAIYGSGVNRTYLALYPAPANNPKYTAPDFHRLELFEEISIFNE